MAGSSSSFQLQLQPQPVQELNFSNGNVPKQYIYSNKQDIADYSATNSAVPVADIPLIDLSVLSSSSANGIEETEKLYSALTSWGCFQAINHGISSLFLDNLHEVIKGFFTLPTEEKQRYSRTVNDHDGYGNDTIFSEYQTLDWCDRLYLQLLPEEKRRLNVWPENPPAFREMVHNYAKHQQENMKTILKAMARSLNLEENCFLDQYGEQGILQARFNFYPHCPKPDQVLGLKPHADGSVITMLLQDREVEGLQFLKDDQWFSAPITPNAVLVSVGDQAEIMSNGIFKSPVHRVTSSERERISLAVFFLPDPENEIKPLKGLISGERGRRYKSVKDYVTTFFEYYQQTKRPIDAARV